MCFISKALSGAVLAVSVSAVNTENDFMANYGSKYGLTDFTAWVDDLFDNDDDNLYS